ncbi:unnamed protein product [marine sediment metagenome]|uniref:Uncharacterized protein n=1 Tax=marine sediment metagenome TaxID=412755 RepID=X1LG48_9ZZZZ
MREAMKKWLSRHQITFSADAANSICSSLGLDGEKIDSCLGLCYQLEKGDINEADFTGGLCVLTGKKPEEVMGVLKGMNVKPSIEAEIANLEKVVTEGGRDVSLIKEWAKKERVSQTQYLQKLKDIVEDLSIPKTFVTSLGIEVEIPVAMAVEALADEDTMSSGFHGALNQRWTIVFRGKVGPRIIKAARVAGLEVSYREMVPGTKQYFTDVSLPDVGISEIEKATEVFNKFAELYEVAE